MNDEPLYSRRTLLSLMATALCTVAFADRSLASDNDGGDSSGGDSSGSGSSESGSDDSDNDSGDHSGSGKNGPDDDEDHDQDDARNAVRNGDAIALSSAMSIVKKQYPGRVIEVRLVKRSYGFDYRFKVMSTSGFVKSVTMDAANGRIRSFLGL